MLPPRLYTGEICYQVEQLLYISVFVHQNMCCNNHHYERDATYSKYCIYCIVRIIHCFYITFELGSVSSFNCLYNNYLIVFYMMKHEISYNVFL